MTPTLLVVHGCERMHRDALDQKIRDYLGPATLAVISFTDVVAEQNTTAVVEINASFYPDETIEARYHELGELVTTLTERPTLVFLTNRHPTERHLQVVTTLMQQKKTGQLR